MSHGKLAQEGVFGHIDKFGKDMTEKLRKTHARTRIKDLFSYLKKYVFRVCFAPFYEDVTSLKYKCPLPPGSKLIYE